MVVLWYFIAVESIYGIVNIPPEISVNGNSCIRLFYGFSLILVHSRSNPKMCLWNV